MKTKSIITRRAESFAIQFDIVGLEELQSDPQEMLFELKSMNESYEGKIDMEDLKAIVAKAIEIKKAEVK